MRKLLTAAELACVEFDDESESKEDNYSPDFRGVGLVRGSTIKQLVEAFQKAESEVRLCFARLVQAEDDLIQVFTFERYNRIRIDASHSGYGTEFGEVERTLDRMKRQAWRFLVERLEMRRVLSVKRFEELEKAVENEKLPDITVANAEAFVDKYAGDLPSMFEDAVKEVFEFLRPWRSTLKTNTQFEIKERVVMHHWVDNSKYAITPCFRTNYHYTQQMRALENVLNALAGNGWAGKSYCSELETAVNASGTDGVGETSLFEFRACKNGNLHLKFKRPELIKKLNAIAGGKRLKPTTESK